MQNGSAGRESYEGRPYAAHGGADALQGNGARSMHAPASRLADLGAAGMPPPPPPPSVPLPSGSGEAGGSEGLGYRFREHGGGEDQGGWRARAGIASSRGIPAGAPARGPGGPPGVHAQLPPAAEAVWHSNAERPLTQVRRSSQPS